MTCPYKEGGHIRKVSTVGLGQRTSQRLKHGASLRELGPWLKRSPGWEPWCGIRAAVAHALQDLAHTQCDSGLAGARSTSETHMQGRDACLKAELEAVLDAFTEHGKVSL